MPITQDLLLFARELEKTKPGADGSHKKWMVRAGDLARECLDGKNLRPALVEEIPILERGPLLRAITNLDGLSHTWLPEGVRNLSDSLNTIISALERAQTRPAIRGSWLRIDPEQFDALVPIAGRKAFDLDFADAIREITPDKPLSVIYSDIDHFKSVNDRFGHPAGDETLKAVAAILSLVCQGKGKAYRVGGEEFAILLPNCSESEAFMTAERLRVAIARQTIPALGQAVSISAGVKATHDVGAKAKDLYKEVDRALYRAKEAGRNRVVACGGGSTPEGIPTSLDIPVSSPIPGGCPPDIPPGVFRTIRQKVETDWPDDFVMRKFEETQQIEAYRELYGRNRSELADSPEENDLLREAAARGEFLLLEAEQYPAPWVRAGGRDFLDGRDPAVAARYLDAFHRLRARDLIRHSSGNLYTLTGTGFARARALPANPEG
jgi:diguanylate cyclase (GGDEF)-like protein